MDKISNKYGKETITDFFPPDRDISVQQNVHNNKIFIKLKGNWQGLSGRICIVKNRTNKKAVNITRLKKLLSRHGGSGDGIQSISYCKTTHFCPDFKIFKGKFMSFSD
ncbi:MAG TPA: hypothetical protein VE035_09360 [Puia sp.]|nr:hypothetical protein [Puia sp.]